jgi:hypothetical protein
MASALHTPTHMKRDLLRCVPMKSACHRNMAEGSQLSPQRSNLMTHGGMKFFSKTWKWPDPQRSKPISYGVQFFSKSWKWLNSQPSPNNSAHRHHRCVVIKKWSFGCSLKR